MEEKNEGIRTNKYSRHKNIRDWKNLAHAHFKGAQD